MKTNWKLIDFAQTDWKLTENPLKTDWKPIDDTTLWNSKPEFSVELKSDKEKKSQLRISIAP